MCGKLIKFLWFLLIVEIVASRSVTHRQTVVDENGKKSVKTWTSEEDDDGWESRSVTEELIRQATKRGMDGDAVREVLHTKQPVTRTTTDDHGNTHVTTYVLESDGSVSRKTNIQPAVGAESDGSASSQYATEELIRLASQHGMDPDAVREVLRTRQSVTRTSTDDHGNTRTTTYKLDANGHVSSHTNIQPPATAGGNHYEVGSSNYGSSQGLTEELIRLASQQGMDPDAVREVLRTRQPVTRTITDNQGNIRTTTYKLNADGTVSYETTIQPPATAGGNHYGGGSSSPGSSQDLTEELIQLASQQGMDPDAVREVLRTRQPVTRTTTDNQGNIRTTTYKLNSDGTVSYHTTIEPQATAGGNHYGGGSSGSGSSQDLTEQLVRLASQQGMDPDAVREVLRTRQPVTRTTTDNQGNIRTTTYKLNADGTVSYETTIQPPATAGGNHYGGGSSSPGSSQDLTEELIRLASQQGMDPDAVREVLRTRQPVTRTTTDNQGNIRTTTYKLNADGTVSYHTTTEPQATAEGSHFGGGSSGSGSSQDLTEELIRLASQRGMDPDAVREVLRTRQPVTRTTTDNQGKIRTTTYKLNADGSVSYETNVQSGTTSVGNHHDSGSTSSNHMTEELIRLASQRGMDPDAVREVLRTKQSVTRTSTDNQGITRRTTYVLEPNGGISSHSTIQSAVTVEWNHQDSGATTSQSFIEELIRQAGKRGMDVEAVREALRTKQSVTRTYTDDQGNIRTTTYKVDANGGISSHTSIKSAVTAIWNHHSTGETSSSDFIEEFIRQAIKRGMDGEAVREVFRTKKPVIRTITDEHGTTRTTTYKLEANGAVSSHTTVQSPVVIEWNTNQTKIIRIGVANLSTEELIKLAIQKGLDSEAVRQLIMTRKPVTWVTTNAHGQRITRIYKFESDGSIVSEIVNEAPSSAISIEELIRMAVAKGLDEASARELVRTRRPVVKTTRNGPYIITTIYKIEADGTISTNSDKTAISEPIRNPPNMASILEEQLIKQAIANGMDEASVRKLLRTRQPVVKSVIHEKEGYITYTTYRLESDGKISMKSVSQMIQKPTVPILTNPMTNTLTSTEIEKITQQAIAKGISLDIVHELLRTKQPVIRTSFNEELRLIVTTYHLGSDGNIWKETVNASERPLEPITNEILLGNNGGEYMKFVKISGTNISNEELIRQAILKGLNEDAVRELLRFKVPITRTSVDEKGQKWTVTYRLESDGGISSRTVIELKSNITSGDILLDNWHLHPNLNWNPEDGIQTSFNQNGEYIKTVKIGGTNISNEELIRQAILKGLSEDAVRELLRYRLPITRTSVDEKGQKSTVTYRLESDGGISSRTVTQLKSNITSGDILLDHWHLHPNLNWNPEDGIQTSFNQNGEYIKTVKIGGTNISDEELIRQAILKGLSEDAVRELLRYKLPITRTSVDERGQKSTITYILESDGGIFSKTVTQLNANANVGASIDGTHWHWPNTNWNPENGIQNSFHPNGEHIKTVKIGGTNIPEEELIQEAILKGMAPDAVREVLRTRQPVTRTSIDNQGQRSTTTYKLDLDGTISSTTIWEVKSNAINVESPWKHTDFPHFHSNAHEPSETGNTDNKPDWEWINKPRRPATNTFHFDPPTFNWDRPKTNPAEPWDSNTWSSTFDSSTRKPFSSIGDFFKTVKSKRSIYGTP